MRDFLNFVVWACVFVAPALTMLSIYYKVIDGKWQAQWQRETVDVEAVEYRNGVRRMVMGELYQPYQPYKRPRGWR